MRSAPPQKKMRTLPRWGHVDIDQAETQADRQADTDTQHQTYKQIEKGKATRDRQKQGETGRDIWRQT